MGKQIGNKKIGNTISFSVLITSDKTFKNTRQKISFQDRMRKEMQTKIKNVTVFFLYKDVQNFEKKLQEYKRNYSGLKIQSA